MTGDGRGRRGRLVVQTLCVVSGLLILHVATSVMFGERPSRPPAFHSSSDSSSSGPSLLHHAASSLTRPPKFINFWPKRPDVRPHDIRVMFLNHHSGTLSEILAVTDMLSRRHNVSIQVTEYMGIWNDLWNMRVTEEEALAYREKGMRMECNSTLYDLIIVGDTIPLIRPHLQNCCRLPMLSWLTTRFDWGMDGDDGWTDLVSKATHWPNFRIYPNNLLEEPYANVHGAHAKFSPYIPGTGLPSGLWASALEDGPQKPVAPNDHVLVVPNSVRIFECVMEPLNERGIEYTAFERNKYGGPLGLTDRIVVHVPYQSNQMGLFENLHQRVIYVVPTIRLYRELGGICDARIEKVGTDDLSDADLESYVDWWRKDLQHLFFYFDSFDDLRPGSALRQRIVIEADAKRAAISTFMVQQRERAFAVWEDVLWGGWGHVEDGEVREGCPPAGEEMRSLSSSSHAEREPSS